MSNLRRNDWAGHAQNYYQQASGSYMGMQKKTGTEGPPKTMGGAIGAGLGTGMAGASAASMGMLGGVGMAAGGAIGAGVGVLSYFLG